MTKCCVIMQPTYLPWAGYFNLIAQSDCFVFLNDVQFEKQSWQNRNRVLAKNAVHWLTVPIKHQHLSDLIESIEVDDPKNWRRKHVEFLRHSYGKHPYGQLVINLVSEVLASTSGSLSELNRSFIISACKLLRMNNEFKLSSDLDVKGARSEKLLRICELLGCDTYLSPVGSADYLEQDAAFVNSSVMLQFQNFVVNPYPQYGNHGFTSHLSIIDVLANLGIEETRKYLM